MTDTDKTKKYREVEKTEIFYLHWDQQLWMKSKTMECWIKVTDMNLQRLITVIVAFFTPTQNIFSSRRNNGANHQNNTARGRLWLRFQKDYTHRIDGVKFRCKYNRYQITNIAQTTSWKKWYKVCLGSLQTKNIRTCGKAIGRKTH